MVAAIPFILKNWKLLLGGTILLALSITIGVMAIKLKVKDSEINKLTEENKILQITNTLLVKETNIQGGNIVITNVLTEIRTNTEKLVLRELVAEDSNMLYNIGVKFFELGGATNNDK